MQVLDHSAIDGNHTATVGFGLLERSDYPARMFDLVDQALLHGPT